jgi:nucleoside-diphosphate-sugar epimerase
VAKFNQSIQRVIVTSSTAAILNPAQPPNVELITDDLWNETSTLDEPGGAYRISKIRAEKLCWQFARE